MNYKEVLNEINEIQDKCNDLQKYYNENAKVRPLKGEGGDILITPHFHYDEIHITFSFGPKFDLCTFESEGTGYKVEYSTYANIFKYDVNLLNEVIDSIAREFIGGY